MPDEGENWLPCLPWDGHEKSLPLGYIIQIPNLNPVELVSRWEVLDAESDEGSRLVKAKELKPNDVIIGAKMNEISIKKIEANYGPDWLIIKGASEGNSFNRIAWRDAFKTDGLILLAIREKRFGRK